jgi:hypothetical protein
MKENINIFELFKNQNKLTKIIIYPVILVENDPYEHTMNSTLLNPVCVKGLVRDISMGKAIWELAGIRDIGTKELIVERRYKDLFKNSGKITINDDEYLTYKDAAGKSLQFIEKQDYLLILLEKKNG